jgi:hypothetical protein
MATTLKKVAELAMQLGSKHLADYGATRSRHDFTQRQLMSCLVLRAYLKTTYRGVLEVIAESQSLREVLGFENKLPHFTTLQKFNERSQVPQIAQAMVASLGEAGAGAAGKRRQAAAMDSTGLSGSTASEYFRTRKGGPCRQWIKLSVVVWCSTLLPMAISVDAGPSNDRRQAATLLQQAQGVGRPSKLYADAGYDAEWIHQQCRGSWKVESIIKALMQCADGTRRGQWRSQMSPEHLKQRGYGKRWAVESFFSALKRKVGSTLSSRKEPTQLAEAATKLLAYAIFR